MFNSFYFSYFSARQAGHSYAFINLLELMQKKDKTALSLGSALVFNLIKLKTLSGPRGKAFIE